MNGDTKTIEQLNKILANELIAINQYFLHSSMLKDWGYKKIADRTWQESVDEMKHARILTDRILFLGGLPNLQDLGKLLIGQTVSEILDCDLKLEQVAIEDLKTAISVCEQANDFISRDILLQILKNEEEHVEWLSTQINLFEKMGEANYLQLSV